jgi:pimeloyl-ACP methyl ester carboxylesterase
MAYVHANGWDFYCEIAGNGPDLVFIHGEIHGIDYWDHQIAEFSRDHRCLIYERRGHRRTGMAPFGFSLENQTRDLEGLINHFGVHQPTLVAVAFGTTIAANYALRHPADVRGIVMVAWSEMHEADQYLERWIRASDKVVRILENDGRDALLDFLRREAGRSLYMVVPLDSPIREACVQMFGGHPADEYRRGMLEFATSVPALVEPFSRLALPVLGVCGEHDPFPDKPEVLAAMTGFREAPPIAWAGRFIQWEKPEAFNALVRGFIADCAAGRRSSD